MDIARLPAPSLQRLFNFLVFMFPKVRNAKRSRRGEENLTWRQAFIKAYMSRGERRRRTVRNTTSRNTRGSGISWQQRLQRFLKNRTTTPRDTINESSALPTNHQQGHSNPEQDGVKIYHHPIICQPMI